MGACCGQRAVALATTNSASDPVCGMAVDPASAQHRAEHRGHPYYFCSAGCREKFIVDPRRYLDQSSMPDDDAVTEGTVYTCPMHPEVRQVGPGSCPICGMALEPEQVSLDDAPDPELADMTRRFWIALALTLPVFAIEMGNHLGQIHLVPPAWSNWISLALSTPVVLWAGAPFFVRGWNSLVTRNLNMFTLIAMGTGVAWAYSVIATLAPQLFPAAFRDMHGAVAVYFEAAAVITVLVLLGQVLELRARRRTGDALRALLDLAPRTARRLTEEGEQEVPLEEVPVGAR
ncbi:MAG: heavy metal-binding domain-containing protein, partial [Rhodanobacteraceae bacterium]